MLRISTILVMLLLWAWGSLALYIAGPEPLLGRLLLVTGFVSVPVGAINYLGNNRRALIPVVFVFGGLMLWWSTLAPSNDRDWAAPTARIPHGTIQGNMLTLNNVRNFDYRSEDDFTERWETRTYDLSRIESLDLYMSYWGSPHIAHTILSWGFANGDHLAVSIETRKTTGQQYSAIEGFFKQFTLAYVAADERDLIRLRTHFRKEQVYLYRLQNISTNRKRDLLESYVAHMNRLVDQPEFYHALTRNCTSTILLHEETNPRRLPADWRLLANGHADELLYEVGGLRKDIPFATLRAQSRVDLAMQQPGPRNFSRRMREVVGIKQNEKIARPKNRVREQ